MKELLFQEIWKQNAGISIGYKTLCGLDFRIESTGEHNKGDGPDFKNASFRFSDGTLLFGDIELHIREEEWYTHRHEQDPAYNAVVLHVFLHGSRRAAKTSAGHKPLRLNYTPHLSSQQIQEAHAGDGLQCSGKVHFIRPELVQEQLDKARRLYFEQRIHHLSEYWSPENGMLESFKRILFVGFAEGLGIDKNRKPMRILAETVWPEINSSTTSEKLLAQLQQKSGIKGSSAYLTSSEWDFSGSRPGNKPAARIRQLASLGEKISRITQQDLMHNTAGCWFEIAEGQGGKRIDLLRNIVWLPAVYMLGTLLFSEKLCRYAFTEWESHNWNLENFISEPFDKAGMPLGSLQPHLGWVYQYKHFCKKGGCETCLIGKELEVG